MRVALYKLVFLTALCVTLIFSVEHIFTKEELDFFAHLSMKDLPRDVQLQLQPHDIQPSRTKSELNGETQLNKPKCGSLSPSTLKGDPLLKNSEHIHNHPIKGSQLHALKGSQFQPLRREGDQMMMRPSLEDRLQSRPNDERLQVLDHEMLQQSIHSLDHGFNSRLEKGDSDLYRPQTINVERGRFQPITVKDDHTKTTTVTSDNILLPCEGTQNWCCPNRSDQIIHHKYLSRVRMRTAQYSQSVKQGSRSCHFLGLNRCTVYTTQYAQRTVYFKETVSIPYLEDCNIPLQCCRNYIFIAKQCIHKSRFTPQLIEALLKLKAAGLLVG